MNQPVTYVEINSPELERSAAFFSTVFGWTLRPFADPAYLVAAADTDPDQGLAAGIDSALLQSRDGQPRAVPVIRVASLAATTAEVTRQGGTVVVAPFTIPGVGRGCYISDPAGVLVGLHEYDPDSR